MRTATLRLLCAALVAIVAIVGVVATSTSAEDVPAATTQTTPDPAQAARPSCPTAHQHNVLVRRTFRYSTAGGNFVARPVGKHKVKRLGSMRSCAKHIGEKNKHRVELRYYRSQARTWRWVHHIDVITPYGKWAIPPVIVMCESGGLWWKSNPSGARGPYELLGHGEPWPANTSQAQAEHHEIAHELYDSAGTSPWNASRSCWG